MSRAVVLGLGVALLLLALTPGAHAQSAEAREHFDLAREHARAERWPEALIEFRASAQLLPRPTTSFNIASTLMRLGRAREAIDEITALEDRTDLDEALRRDLAALRAAAMASLRTLVVRASPADLHLSIDGVAIAGTGAERSILLDPGVHVLLASAPGHEDLHASLAPDQVALDVALVTLPAELAIEADVPDAAISVDGASWGLGHATQSVAHGTHVVHVARDGRTPFDTEVTLAPAEHALVTATLPPLRSTPIAEEPAFWAVLGSSVAVVVAVSVGVGVALTPSSQPYGGSTNVVIAPLWAF